MKFLNFKEFGKQNENLSAELEGKLSNDQIGSKLYILDLIEKSLETSDLMALENFIKNYLEGDKNSYIQGLSNDAELFEFYAKYQVELDEILADDNYFDKSPKEMNVYSVYEYVTKAAQRSLELLLSKIQQESFGS